MTTDKLPLIEDYCWDDISTAPLTRVILGYQPDKPHVTYHMMWWQPSQQWAVVTPRTGEFKVIFDWIPEPQFWMEVGRPRYAGRNLDGTEIDSEILNEGDIVTVKVDGQPYPTIMMGGVQRFIEQDHPLDKEIGQKWDPATQQMLDDLNGAWISFRRGKWPKRTFMEYYMSRGYSVSGFCDVFTDVDVENPIWL